MARPNRGTGFDLYQPVAERFACCFACTGVHASGDRSSLFGAAMGLLQTRLDRSNGSRMNHPWHVSVEVPNSGTLVRRRSPRLTKTFQSEAEAREFARVKFEDGLIVAAGTINPHLPRRAIASADIPDWLK